MTTEQLRELDAWIAEHVMGWRRANKPWMVGPGCFFANGKQVFKHIRGCEIDDFCPTTSPADAMMVLEKCAKLAHKDGKRIAIRPSWVVSAWNNYEQEWIEANTLPLAICLFARQLFSK